MSMKEYLDPKDWSLKLVDVNNDGVDKEWIAVPDGADVCITVGVHHKTISFYKDDYCFFCNDRTKGNWEKSRRQIKNHDGFSILWKRTETLNNKVATVEVDCKHSHYKKDVSDLEFVDVYRVLDLFEVKSHAVGHAIKKLLCSGERGAKSREQDIQEAIDSLNRELEMMRESK